MLNVPATDGLRRQWHGVLSVLGAGAMALSYDDAQESSGVNAVWIGGCFALGSGLAGLRQGPALRAMAQARALEAESSFEEAARRLEAVPSYARWGLLGVQVDLERARIALRRGDFEAASAGAGGVLASTTRHPRTDRRAFLEVGALAVRALASASLGRRRAVEDDVAAIREAKVAMAEHLARAALAEAVLLSRGGRHTELREHLAKHRRLLMTAAHSSERALARALERSATAISGSAYRSPAAQTSEPLASKGEASWIEQVAPEAAGFAPVGPEGSSTDGPAPLPFRALVRTARKVFPTPKTRNEETGFITLASLAVGFGTVLCLHAARPVRATRRVAKAASFVLTGKDLNVALPIAAFVFFLLFVILHQIAWKAGIRRWVAAAQARARGESEAAEAQLLEMASSRAPAIAALGHAELAQLAFTHARFDAALHHADLGLAWVERNPGLYAATSGPPLMSTRAMTLACLGKEQEARTELDVLEQRYPLFTGIGETKLQVPLLSALHRRDIDGARALAASRSPRVALAANAQMLAEALTATTPDRRHGDEARRALDELQDDAELRAWVAAVWPGAERELTGGAA